MRKGNLLYNVKAAFGVGAASLLLCASCTQESTVDVPAGASTVNIGITLRVGSMNPVTRSDGDGFVAGTDYENYIDVQHNDYRIYFFTNSASNGNDTYLGTFEPINGVANYGTNYTSYSLFGSVPEQMINETDFKVMVLANLGKYDDTVLVTGSTTIDNVCSATWTQFNYLTDCALSEENLIPFFGIHAYTGYSFAENEVVELSEPITLLRAMAKVEVVMDDDDGYTFSKVVITRSNAKGYCAPANVYSEKDYGQGDDWNNDNLDALHLVNGTSNDSNTSSYKITFTHIDDAENDTWVAYMPEYKNNGGTLDTNISATLNGGDNYTIYFANYGEDGTLESSYSADNCYSIQRNNLYRFTVSVYKELLNVHVDKWDEVFTNQFEFGVSTQGDDEETEDDD